MKKTVYLFLLAAIVAACNMPTTPTAATTTEPRDSTPVAVSEPQDSLPKDSSAVASKDTAAASGRIPNPNGQVGGRTFSVTGKILIAGSYCGGAAPSPEMEAEARRPKPFANQQLLIREGKANGLGTPLVTRTRTDANGDFKLDLRPGSYCLVLEEKERTRDASFYALKNQGVDRPCDQKWLNACDLTFTVADRNITGLSKTFNKKCFITSLSPCVTYTGPKPPAAAPRDK